MKKKNLFLVLLLVVGMLFPVPVKANAAEPPCFMIMVENPPADLKVYAIYNDNQVNPSVELGRIVKAWEGYYRFFYHSFRGDVPDMHDNMDLDKLRIRVETGGESFECALPHEDFVTYDNILTLDLKTRTLKQGEPSGRSFKLFLIRLALTVLIEGIVFFLFGYRKVLSWIIFLVINIMTQGFLNIAISGPHSNSYWILMYYFLEVMIFGIEMILFGLIVREHGWKRSVGYAFVANLASLVVGGILLAILPV